MAARHYVTAVNDVKLYAEGALKAGRQDMASPQVLAMARLVSNVEFLEAAGEALQLLDAAADAEKVLGWANSGGSGEHLDDPELLVEACLKAAVGSNKSRRSEGAVA